LLYNVSLCSCIRCSIMSRPVHISSYTCLVCQHTGFNWHDLGCVPPPHAGHRLFMVRCNSCHAVFRSRTAFGQHLIEHLRRAAGVVSSPGHRYRPYTTVPVLMTSMHPRQLMFDIVAHLVWLAAYVLRPPFAYLPGEVAFRHRLAQQYSTVLAGAVNMTVPDIVRILLPVYERRLATARDAVYYYMPTTVYSYECTLNVYEYETPGSCFCLIFFFDPCSFHKGSVFTV